MIKQAETRRSVRKYESRPVEKEKLTALIDCARLAPSGSNTQPWRFIIVTNRSIMEKIVLADHDQKWMMEAPAFIVCVGEMSARMGDAAKDMHIDDYSGSDELKKLIRDCAIAQTYIWLEAENQGLGACWTGWYEQGPMRKALNLPDNCYVCGVTTVGYAAEFPAQRPRKNLDEIIEWVE